MESESKSEHEPQPLNATKELHAHISGSIDPSSICDLIYQNDLHLQHRDRLNSITEPFGIRLADAITNNLFYAKENFSSVYTCPPNGENRFNEVMQRFNLTSSLLQLPGIKSDFGELVCKTFKEQGIEYVEWRVDPFSSTQNETADEALEKLSEYYSGMQKVDLDSRFILSLSRARYTNNSGGIDYVKLEFLNNQTEDLLRYKEDLPIIGIDVSNAEVVPLSVFKDVFDLGQSYGLGTVPHVGKGTNPTLEEGLDDVQTALSLPSNRLGHAIVAYSSLDDYLGRRDVRGDIYDRSRIERLKARQLETLQQIRENDVAIEVCPTSNLCAHLGLRTFDQHPIDRLAEMRIPFVICSDDPGIFGRSLQEETEGITQAKGLPKTQIIENANRRLLA